MPYTEGSASNFEDVHQAIINFCCGTKYNQAIGSAPLQTLNFTLTNTPCAKGNIRVKLKQGTTEFYVWDNGETTSTWQHPEITSSSMNYSTGVGQIVLAAALPTGYTAYADYCVGQNGGEEGRDWILLQHRDTQDDGGSDAFPGEPLKESWMKNSGVSYKEPIYIGFREFQYATETLYNVNMNVDYTLGDPPDDSALWNFHKTLTGRTGYNATREAWTELPSIALRDDSMYYWIFSNKNRIMGAVRVATSIYATFYQGAGFRYSSPSRYKYPLLSIGSIDGINNFSHTGYDHVFIIDPTGYNMLLWGKDDIPVDETDQFVYPKEGFSSAGTCVKCSDNDIPLWPVFVTMRDGSLVELLLELDGLYFAMDNVMQSESKVQISGDDYLIIQNVFRTTYQDYLLMKME